MRNLIIIAILFCSCGILTANPGPIKGNGNVTTQTREVTDYQQIFINFGVRLEIDGSQDAPLSVTIDDNLTSNLITKVENGVLTIDQKGWIAPTKTVVVKIGKTNLTKITSDAHATTLIRDFTGAKLNLVATVGKISVSGSVAELLVENENAEVDAVELAANSVTINHDGWGDTEVTASESLIIQANGSGKIIYRGNPINIQSKINEDVSLYPYDRAQELAREVVPVDKVKIRLVNNSLRRIQTKVKGPQGQRFSYGIPFNPGQVRSETWPIGTKLYLTSGVGQKVLYEVKAGDDEQKQRLFPKEH